MKKICVITGTRADYGLLYWLMKDIQSHKDLNLQTIATGMHVSPEFGLTYNQIKEDGFNIDKEIEMIISADTPSSVCKSTGLGLIGFADAFNDLKPDIVILLGDRYELLAAASACLIFGIPVCHIHGGETTVGAFDEAIRHSITKMSWWHFVAANDYRKRVIQLGENPKRVFLVGGLGVDGIKKTTLLDKNSLEKKIKFRFGKKNLIVTYHPLTLANRPHEDKFDILLKSLKKLKDTNLIFTLSNSDTYGRIINSKIKNFVNNNKNAIYFTSMGQLNYLSALQYVDAVVGNSSSGLLEAPSFRIGTINIGNRQKGRIRSNSVIDCNNNLVSISKALKKLYSPSFKKKLDSSINPYDAGIDATKKIIDVLVASKIPKNIQKEFYNL